MFTEKNLADDKRPFDYQQKYQNPADATQDQHIDKNKDDAEDDAEYYELVLPDV